MFPILYDQLGDIFEDREHQLFGTTGFEGIIVQISDIEKTVGLYDLSQFTPKINKFDFQNSMLSNP